MRFHDFLARGNFDRICIINGRNDVFVIPLFLEFEKISSRRFTLLQPLRPTTEFYTRTTPAQT